MTEQDPSLNEPLKDPQEEITEAAWGVVDVWLRHEMNGDSLEDMPATVSKLRQALTDGDSMGLTDPSSPYYTPESA